MRSGWGTHLGSEGALHELQQQVQLVAPELQVSAAGVSIPAVTVVKGHRHRPGSHIHLRQRQALHQTGSVL